MTSTYRYILPYSLFAAGRMGIGATVTIYMLSKGISLADIAFIKIVQAIVIFFAEVPTGLVADHYGRKVSTYCSIFFAILSFACFALGSSVQAFAIAEAFNALTICFWSGAFTALVVDSYSLESQKEGFLESLFSKMNVFSAASIMIAGLAGGLLYDVNPIYPFLLSAAFMLVAFVSLKFLIKNDRPLRSSTAGMKLGNKLEAFFKAQKTQLVNVVSYIKNDPRFIYFFMIQILVQFAYQPIFHYWQPYLQELSNQDSANLLGIAFFLYVGADLVLNLLSKLFLDRKPHLARHLLVFEVFAMAAFLSLMASANVLWMGLSAFLLAQGFGGNMRALLEASLNRRIGPAQRATFLSTVSFISRGGMFASLALISVIVESLGQLSHLYFISSASLLLIVPFFIAWIRQTERKDINISIEVNAA